MSDLEPLIAELGLHEPYLHPHGRPDLHLLIQHAALGDPDLPYGQRGPRVQAVAAVAGVSVATVYTHVRRVSRGLPYRKPRADRGAIRALSARAAEHCRALCLSKEHGRKSTATLHRELQRLCPGEDIPRDAVARLRAQLRAQLAAFGTTYRDIVVARPNEQWQMDCSLGDFFCLHPATGKPFRPQFTLCLDAATRSIMYAVYSVRTDYLQIASCLHQAIRRQSDAWPQHGLPEALVVDNGKVFVGDYLQASLSHLGIDGVWSHPYYPQDKGKCERAIGTVHQMFEQLLPGWCGPDNRGEHGLDTERDFRARAPGVVVTTRNPDVPLLSLAEANERLWTWIAGLYNHEHVNRDLGVTCLQAWVRGWLQCQDRPRTYDEAYLETAFLPCEPDRKVTRGRLRFKHFDYVAPELTGRNGAHVAIRFDPHDLREVYVYQHGLRVCTARLAVPFLHTAPQELAAWEQSRQEKRAQARRKQAFVAGATADPAARADLSRAIDESLAAAAPTLAPEAQVVPTPEQQRRAGDAALDDLFMGELADAVNQ